MEEEKRLGEPAGNGRKTWGPVFGNNRRLRDDPHFRPQVLFRESFHGDTGCGVAASHQAGWTGLVATRRQPRRKETPALGQATIDAEMNA